MIKLKGNKFLVTGGAGFIGSHICDALIAQDKEVVCVDNLVNGKMENIERHLHDPKFSFLKIDIRDLYPRNFEGVDVVFHEAASKFTVCRIDPKKDLMVNGWGALNVFECAYSARVRRVIHASSGSVLGGIPKSYYGLSKYAGESYLRLMNLYYPAFDYVTLRYYHVYGSRQDNSLRGGVIPIFMKQILENRPTTIYGNGKQLRHFTSVDDIVKVNLMAAENESMSRKIYNIIPKRCISINELSVMMHRIMGREEKKIHLPEKPGEIYEFYTNSDEIEKLGFVFDVSIEDGVAKLMR